MLAIFTIAGIYRLLKVYAMLVSEILPMQARLDGPGAMHHDIPRGITMINKNSRLGFQVQ